MLKIHLLSLLLITCLFHLTANPLKDSLKDIVYGNEKIDEIQANGFVKLLGTQVNNKTKIQGKLYCSKASIGQIIVNGPATIIESTIRGRAVIKGSLKVSDTTFLENLEITATSAEISSSTLNSIFIFRPKNYSGTLLLKLNEQTLLKGSVIFESPPGKVISKNGSQVKSSIVNGTLSIEEDLFNEDPINYP